MSRKELEIKSVKNEHDATVYHVEEESCIQEFWTLKEAKEYVEYVAWLNSYEC